MIYYVMALAKVDFWGGLINTYINFISYPFHFPSSTLIFQTTSYKIDIMLATAKREKDTSQG